MYNSIQSIHQLFSTHHPPTNTHNRSEGPQIRTASIDKHQVLVGIATFYVIHTFGVFINLKEYKSFKRTEEKKFETSIIYFSDIFVYYHKLVKSLFFYYIAKNNHRITICWYAIYGTNIINSGIDNKHEYCAHLCWEYMYSRALLLFQAI